MESLLQEVWPRLLKRFKVNGSIHVIEVNPTEGLIVKTLSKNEVLADTYFTKVEEIETLKIDILFKVYALEY